MATILLLISLILPTQFSTSPIHLRVNQLGYLPGETKVAIAFSHSPLKGKVFLKSEKDNSNALKISPIRSKREAWGTFEYYYEIDFSEINASGDYYLETEKSGDISQSFHIGPKAYRSYHEDLLTFMRQQRCGYNPFLDMVCHQRDGRTMFGPMADSTFLDASGGWHDAGDQLKYLITSSYATAHMLKAYQLYPDRFADKFNALGQPGANGIPDVLDEAKWGLDWIHKLHPQPDQLFHQIADDRDHRGWKIPDEDISDYGWGPNSYRVVYFATGEPQGLQKYKSQATGVANLAGRCAAAMALAYQIWKDDLNDPSFSETCLKAAKSLYALGKAKEGFQQGNSYGAPYRYNEDTWADDMEWGAAELYDITGDQAYLEDGKRYARLANTETSWMQVDTAEHYKLYPFINIGHYALYEHVDQAFKDTLAGYYRSNIEACVNRASRNPFDIGVSFIWCSNNLLTGLVTEIILYEKMTGDTQFHGFMVAQRDWFFGRNPWGTSMFTGIPRDGEYPLDVHTSVYVMTKKMVPGGLIDGPLYGGTHRQLLGLELIDPDEFAHLQNRFVVYHDDIGDYSTNEPTMDGTAGAMIMMADWVEK